MLRSIVVGALAVALACHGDGSAHDDATTSADATGAPTSAATASDPTGLATSSADETSAAAETSSTGGPDGPNGAMLFATDVLHQIEITVEDQYLAQLDSDTENRVPCTITYDGTTVTDAGIRRKGMSTLQPLADKPSFSIKLDETVAGQDIDGIEKFALNNTMQDPTFSSEPLSYLLYQRAGIAAPRTGHAAVRFNGETKGFYVVVESVNKQFLADHFGDGSGNLYEGPWDFDQDPAAADLKDVEDGRTRDDLIALTEAIAGATPDTLDAAISPLADVDQLLTVFALDMAFCLWDGYTITAWNFYLYHVPGGRFVMLPHGADWPYWVADLDPMDPDFRPWGAEYPAGLLAIDLTAPPFVERYGAALASVRDQAFDVAALSARVDEIDATLHQADAADPVLADELSAFDEHVQEARSFVSERRAFLDSVPL